MLRRTLPAAALLVLAACGSSGSGAPDAEIPSSPTTVVAAPAPAATGDVAAAVPEALRFTAPLLGGGDIEMAGLAGRPVLLWFWAPW